MTHLRVRPEHWFNAAERGDVVQLDRWVRGGVLKHRFDPTTVEATPGSGRPSFPRLLNKKGESALIVALRHYRVEYALRLLAVAKFPPSSADPVAAFQRLVCIRDARAPLAELAASLIEQGHLPQGEKDSETPLAVAVQTGNWRAVKLLLSLGVRPADNPAALKAVFSVGHIGTVEAFLAAGIRADQPCGPHGEYPLMYAAAMWMPNDNAENSDRRRTVRTLVQAGADPAAEMEERDGTRITAEEFLFLRASGPARPINASSAEGLALAAFREEVAAGRALRLAGALSMPSIRSRHRI